MKAVRDRRDPSVFRLTPIAAALAGAGLLASPYTAVDARPDGAMITVSDTCTLVDAVASSTSMMAVNGCVTGYGFDTIVLPAHSTQTLSTYLDINSTITIQGNGSTIQKSGGNTSAVFKVEEGRNLTLNGVTVTGGGDSGIFNAGSLTLNSSKVTGNSNGSNGGGIVNHGTQLTLNDSTVSGNTAGGGNGGGIASFSGIARLTNVKVSGNYAYNEGGGIHNEGTLYLSNSVVTGNSAGNDGGGIKNASSLTMTNSVVSGNNTSYDGGGLASSQLRKPGGKALITPKNVSVTIQQSSISAKLYGSSVSNNRGYDGGGIYSTGSLTLDRSTVSGNSATHDGGGIENVGTVSANYSTVFGNNANRNGGGIATKHSAALSLVNSTVFGNSAGNSGGGVASGGSTASDAGNSSSSLVNSTVFGNHAAHGGGVAAFGRVVLNNSTVSGNSASTNGGGIYHSPLYASGSMDISNSLITGNVASAGAELYRSSVSNSGATILAGNSNLFGHVDENGAAAFTNFTISGNSQNRTSDGGSAVALNSIVASALGINGGPTLTLALVSGASPNPAVDGVSDSNSATSNDQRGYYYAGSVRDIGAFELTSATVAGSTVSPYSDIDEANITITSSSGTISDASVSNAPSGVPTDNVYPNGFFSFNLTGLTPGAQVTVTLALPDPGVAGKPNGYVKCAGADCAAVPVSVGGSDGVLISADGKTVTLKITDGGPLDGDGVVNGMIIDPGAPAVLVIGGGGGANISGGAFGWLTTLLLAPMAWLRRRRAKRQR